MKIIKIAQKIELWLDDERDPKNTQIQKDFSAKGSEIWVKNVPEAIQYLSKGNVSSISFDNDLGVELEGYDLAKYIEEMAYYNKIPKLTWKIHSKNPTAALRIQQAMINADRYWNKS